MLRNRERNRSVVMILASGIHPSPNKKMTSVFGLLIRRHDESTVSFWNGDQWKAANAAGWPLQMGIAKPEIPVGSWAIITAPALAKRKCCMKLRQADVVWALHTRPISATRHKTAVAVPDCCGGAVRKQQKSLQVTAH